MGFEDLLSFYLSEGMDRQILRKLPYAAIPAIIAFNVQAIWNVRGPPALFVIVLLACLAIFGFSTFLFLRRLGNSTKDLFKGLELRAALKKFKGTYEQQISLLGDIFKPSLKGKEDTQEKIQDKNREPNQLTNDKKSTKREGITIAVVSGVSTFLLLSLALFEILVYSRISVELSLVIAVFVIFYLLYDISKANYFEEEERKEAESKSSFGVDFYERYAIVNSLKRLPAKSRSLLYAVGRVLAPLVYVSVPKFTVDQSLVYQSARLKTTIEEFQEKATTPNDLKDESPNVENGGPEKRGFYLKREAGGKLDFFFDREGYSTADWITALVELGPMELFPYLLDPTDDKLVLKDSEEKWVSFKVLSAEQDTLIGHVIVHRFKGVFVKRMMKVGRKDPKDITTVAFQFFFLGEKGEMQYIKSQIELNAGKVPPSALTIEVEPA